MNREDIDALFTDEDEPEEDRKPLSPTAGMWPYPLASGGAQLLPGRTRACGFWVSPHVPFGTRYVVDSARLSSEPGQWLHNVGGDALPENALLVVISPLDESHIRKAMATYPPRHPAFVAARIIDAECRKDQALAKAMRWKVVS